VTQSRVAQRQQAIRLGLEFIYRTACEPKNFEAYGFDYLGCFHGIASTSKDKALRDTALRMGRERARCWRRNNPVIPPHADADAISYLVHGSAAADKLGVPGKRLKKQIHKVAARFTVLDYLCFDPKHEPPPTDVPDECECGIYNTRGCKVCSKCKGRLSMLSSYAVWLDALIRTYIGERYGSKLGASFADVIKWLPAMRPYPGYEDGENPDFDWAIYAVTHVVYTLNDYSVYRLSKSWLPHEYAFLKRNLKQAITMEDPETTGEFLDSLQSFGLSENHTLIRTGMDYLLATQNPDGSWGDTETDDIYQRYHPTWTAIDGLREYAWQGLGLSFPQLEPLLVSWARKQRRQSIMI
jgi:hypothetical protein